MFFKRLRLKTTTPVQRLNDRRIVATGSKAEVADATDEISSEVVSWGALRVNKKQIETALDLAQINFADVINEKIQISLHLYSSIAIALVNETSKDCILFIDPKTAQKGQVEAAVQLLKEKNYKLTDLPSQGYFLNSALILALAKKDITKSVLSFERSLAKDPQKNALMSTFIDVVGWANANRADDIDFALETESAMSQICFKIGGKYVRPDRWNLPSETMKSILGIAYQKSGGGSSAQFDPKIEQQALVRLELPATKDSPNAQVRLRWSGMSLDKGCVVTCRIQRLGQSALIKSLNGAGYLQSQMDIIDRVLHSEGGMVVLAGVVGSGKSTSLVQMVKMLPPDIKIQTLEDPVELDIPHAYQKTIVRDLTGTGKDDSFSSATKALYRSALDVLYLGEVRDETTGLVARQVVESGHSVYTTTHARSGLGIIDRFSSPAIGMPRDVLSTPGIMKLMVYQALLPTNCPYCSKAPDDYARAFNLQGKELDAHQRYFDNLEYLYGITREVYRMHDHMGCPRCIKPELPELNGFAGRTVVAEMIEPDEEMLGYIFKGDNIGRDRYWREMASKRFDDTNLTGKTTMECAVYKAIRGANHENKPCGNIDPREIEPRFMSFTTVRFKREYDLKMASRSNTSSISVPLADTVRHFPTSSAA